MDINKDNLPSTDDFEIIIVEPKKSIDFEVYGVCSKHTSIIEHKNASLSRIYSDLCTIQDEYDKMMKMISNEEVAQKKRVKSSSKIVKIT